MTAKILKLPGFSLLELMIATVLGSMLLLTASTLFMTFMVGNANTNARRQMSAEGTQMLGTLEYHIRNAKGAVCSGTGNTVLTLTKLDGSQAQACFASNKLNFNATGIPCINPLNSDFVVMPGSSFLCPSATNGIQTVTINFTLQTSVDSTIQETFSRIIQLRNS